MAPIVNGQRINDDHARVDELLPGISAHVCKTSTLKTASDVSVGVMEGTTEFLQMMSGYATGRRITTPNDEKLISDAYKNKFLHSIHNIVLYRATTPLTFFIYGDETLEIFESSCPNDIFPNVHTSPCAAIHIS